MLKKMIQSALLLILLVVFVGNAESLQSKETIGLQAEAIRLNRDHSLILVPVVHSLHRRSAGTSGEDGVEADKQPKKYQRLAHSVHVQSDIRYR
jgi:hypothetical protein